jgi:hypothetical protein
MRASIASVLLSLTTIGVLGCGGDDDPITPDAAPQPPAFKGFEADEGGEIRLEYVHTGMGDGIRAVAFVYKDAGSTNAFPLPNLNGCTDMTKKANWPMAVNPLPERVYMDVGDIIISDGTNSFTVTKQTTENTDFLARTHPANKWYFRFEPTRAFDFLTPTGKASIDVIFTGSDEVPPQVLKNVQWMPAAFDLMTPGFEITNVLANTPVTFTWTNPPQEGLPAGYVVLSLVGFAGPMPSDGLAVLCVEPNDGSLTVPADMVNIARAKFPNGGTLARATFTHVPRELVDKDGPTGRRLDVVTTWCHAIGWRPM